MLASKAALRFLIASYTKQTDHVHVYICLSICLYYRQTDRQTDKTDRQTDKTDRQDRQTATE